jgi:hypothetical protein
MKADEHHGVSPKGRCPHCGNFLPELSTPDADFKERAVELRAELEASGYAVLPGGRVGEAAAAAALGLSPATLRNWRARGTGGPLYCKAGGRVLYELAALARFLRG